MLYRQPSVDHICWVGVINELVEEYILLSFILGQVNRVDPVHVFLVPGCGHLHLLVLQDLEAHVDELVG